MTSRLWMALGGIAVLGAAAAATILLLTGPGAPGHEPSGAEAAPAFPGTSPLPPGSAPTAAPLPLQAALPPPSAFPPAPPVAAPVPPQPAPPALIPGPPVVPLPADRERAVEKLAEVRQERFENAMDALNRRTAARRGVQTAPARAASGTIPVPSSRRGALVAPKP